MSSFVRSRSRRAVLAGALVLAGAVSITITGCATESSAESTMAAQPQAPWLAGLNGTHRQLFDSPTPGGGIPLVHIMNYMDTYNSAFKVADSDINAIGTFYGGLTFHGLNDAMWTKYKLGAFLGGMGIDAGKGTTANPWRASPEVLGMSLAPASIEALQKRGAKFILCNNALTIFSGMVAQKNGLDAKVVYDDMRANVLSGVEVVPAMVIAIEQAQKAGIAYHRQ